MTFSIVAHDPSTRQIGLAVQSRAFGVGRIIHHIHPGVGAVASQAGPEAPAATAAAAAPEVGAEPALCRIEDPECESCQ